jgi:hypothetical protein
MCHDHHREGPGLGSLGTVLCYTRAARTAPAWQGDVSRSIGCDKEHGERNFWFRYTASSAVSTEYLAPACTAAVR